MPSGQWANAQGWSEEAGRPWVAPLVQDNPGLPLHGPEGKEVAALVQDLAPATCGPPANSLLTPRQTSGPAPSSPELGFQDAKVEGSSLLRKGTQAAKVVVPVSVPAGAVMWSQMGNQFMCPTVGSMRFKRPQIHKKNRKSKESGARGQSVTHTGPPIVVTLANTAVTFICSITYPYTSKFKDFTVSYYHIDLQGQRSAEEQTACRSQPGTENQTYILQCQVTPKLPDSSATGTYYCYVHWPDYEERHSGPFILVRDTGYREPPQIPRKPLLIGFTSLLSVLSVLGTALLFWKKKQMQTPGKHSPEKRPDPKSASSPKQPPAESVYTALQRRETEVYACIESEDTSPPSTRSPFSQENPHRFEDDSEFNLVYENL
ncbi:PREDICTED: NFAT activation molecule 1 [Galeopterus variegatus]|uniref:NFAT activation molecule 1 n=1 Tax=Galeopterus variegatus TaxID=482537 RepID=A0ABM0QWJ7_GALVR|nr:PREDICTED: NFAT activation molecule 1 [Galeopterus variegatus]